MDTGARGALLTAQRTAPKQPTEETAALRREAVELLSRSRWWRDECRRELLRDRRWYGVPSESPGAELKPDDQAGAQPRRGAGEEPRAMSQ
jgi:hypothetical protein